MYDIGQSLGDAFGIQAAMVCSLGSHKPVPYSELQRLELLNGRAVLAGIRQPAAQRGQ